MGKTVEQGQEHAIEEPRTFTQEEVDQIVADRLKRERTKYADYDTLKEKASKFDEQADASKTELQKAIEKVTSLESELNDYKAANQIREIRESVSKATGVPASLLTATSEEDCTAQANEILAFAKPSGYPSVKDGGETHTNPKYTPKQLFADWAEKAFN